jgi:DNA-binding CsgD family transcriptional regulator
MRRTRIVEETGTAGEYRFAHALMRETLLAELSASRRVRLHAEIAEALERLEGETSTERVAELAAHYAESAALSRAHARKAAHYLRLAAEQAEGQYAWAEAARHYERCVPLLEQGDELQLAEVLHAHGRAAWGAGDWRGAGSILVRALDIYRKHEGHVAFARVALDLLRTPAPAAQHQAIVGEALKFAPQLAPELEARLRAGLLFVRPEELDDATTAARVQELSSTLALPDVEARLLFARLLQTPPSDGEEAERLARTMIARFQEAGERIEAARSQQMLCAVILWSGDLDRAAREYAAWLHDCERLGLGWSAGVARTALAEIHLLRNDMEQHEEARRAISAERLGFDLLPAVRAERAGALDEAVRLLPPRETAGGVPGFMSLLFGCRARILLRAGRREEARQEFEAWWDASKHLTYTLFLPGMCIEECLTEFGTREAVELAYRRTGELSWRRYIPLAHLSNDRARGMLALHLGLLDEAEQHYRAGVEWSGRERCPVELGRCHQGLADVADCRGDPATARKHLNEAVEQFTSIGAKLYLDQVAAKLAALPAGAAARPRYPDGLSEREVEVLRLVTAGRSNREIAGELVISLSTVERHVANIYTKIDVRRRTQAAAYARRHGLDAPGEPTAT